MSGDQPTPGGRGERLSVRMAKEHVENGHHGNYAHYCYRCQFFEYVHGPAAGQEDRDKQRDADATGERTVRALADLHRCSPTCTQCAGVSR